MTWLTRRGRVLPIDRLSASERCVMSTTDPGGREHKTGVGLAWHGCVCAPEENPSCTETLLRWQVSLVTGAALDREEQGMTSQAGADRLRQCPGRSSTKPASGSPTRFERSPEKSHSHPDDTYDVPCLEHIPHRPSDRRLESLTVVSPVCTPGW